MDIVQANLIENMVDGSIGKHYKIIDLEKNSEIIKQTVLTDGKRMDNMEADIKNIKDSQVVMAGNIASITKSINGNGIKGIADMVEDNARRIGELITNTVVNTCDVKRLDKISWIIGGSFITGFIGLVIYLARMSMTG